MSKHINPKNFTGKHLYEMVAMCGGVALLLFAAVFITTHGPAQFGKVVTTYTAPGSQAAAIWPCSWFGDCPYASKSYYGVTASAPSVAPGQPVTLNWVAYTSTFGINFSSCRQGYRNGLGIYQSYFNCSITGVGAVGTQCTDTPAHYDNVCTISYDKFGNPINTCVNTYIDATYCDNFSSAAPSGSVTVYPTQTTTYTFCGSYYWGTSDGQNYSVRPYPTPCPSATVVVTSPSCANGLGSSYYPSCTCPSGQTQSGASCVATPSSCPNGLNATSYPSCTCPSGQAQSGSTCIAIPSSCPNGLNPASYPSCTCPSGQTQSGSTCVITAPSSSCSNGLANSYAPSCTCPVGQTQSGSVCVPSAPTSCSNGLSTTYLPSCTCPSGQVQSGTQCVASGVINSLSANPTRVRKGNSTTVAWSTSNMATCTLKGPNPSAGGIATLSTALSNTLNATVTSQSVFTLTCVDNVGTARSQSVTVNLVPDVIEQ